MRRLFVPVFFALAACSSPKTEETQAEETPTEDVSNATSDPVMTLERLLTFDSEEKLIEIFGANNVTRETRYCPEGMCEYTATIVLKDQPNEIEYKWKDSINFRGVDEMAVYGIESTWGTEFGLGPGTTLKELEKMNGKPFQFAGFGWDYGGIVSWDGGNLDTLSATVVLDMPPNNSHPESDSLMGDRMDLISSQRIPQEINPVVYSIRFRR
ncbi:MAG TPA: hypothetical protein VFE50_23175 [Cyclobacteriaceae bacterium]|nr:hypothetical protein [Cyclobacteriaceae bacterium]